MFDPLGAFKKQFTRVEEGYLFYPSRKSGGKLVTADEYTLLVADWERVAGRAGLWKMIGVVIAAIFLWVLLSKTLSLPDWANSLSITATVLAISAWVFWASFAPHRLAKDRAAVTPPRPAAEAGREARAGLNWPFVLFALLLSGTTFLGTVTASERKLSTWAWLVGSGVMLGAYLWIGLRKLLDMLR